MKRIGVTGAGGFMGTNLCVALERAKAYEVRRIARDGEPLTEQLRGVEVLVHFAGVNRVAEDHEFVEGNIDYTRRVCEALDASKTAPLVLFASSIHAEADTPYGRSKRGAEDVLFEWARKPREGVRPSLVVYRLPNVFGKWGRPRYNSAVATFAYAIARGEPYEVHDPAKLMRLVYVDDVVEECMRRCAAPFEAGNAGFGSVEPVHEITLGELARTFESFAAGRQTNQLPSLDDALTRKLLATYTANLRTNELVYPLHERSDPRGTLAEVVKSSEAGQIFVSVTRPGAIRGNHFHDTKTEKFLVLRGSAAIDMHDLKTDERWRISTSGARWEVIDIPPGVAHRITNVGADELVMLFWSSEPFDPARPDTHPSVVPNA